MAIRFVPGMLPQRVPSSRVPFFGEELSCYELSKRETAKLDQALFKLPSGTRYTGFGYYAGQYAGRPDYYFVSVSNRAMRKALIAALKQLPEDFKFSRFGKIQFQGKPLEISIRGPGRLA